ncbi:MAG: alpha-L-fucosidase, partial [Pirellulaceae bacterium]|nr:alpha-L-fucosidase [Pirellulaceae bacterium]
MKTKTTGIVMSLFLAATGLGAEAPDGLPAPGATAARPCWHKAPTVSVMTGFIYEPKKPYTIQQWMENLGSKFDADRWVEDFQEAGASYVIFYDKWIDGLVFHDTKTTNFKTKRDFLRELAAACQRGGLPLVIYFNAISDGNPEFDEWALLDRDGQPIVFGAAWPTRYQTLHSPFRQKCLEQARELLSNYGPIHGIWFDIFHERFHTTSPWTARGYQQMFGEPFETATSPRLAEFQARTLAGYLDQVAAIRREQRQEQCLFTANGSGSAFIGGGLWTEQVGSRLQYLYNEGHSFQNNEELARLAWALPKPLDINLLLVSSWFTPLEDAPPPASLTVEQAIAATAIAVCQGAGVNFALTPGHDGTFGEDLQRAKAVGAWFRKTRPWLEGAQPAADVAVVHGPQAGAVTEALTRAGVFSRWIAPGQPLPACRAIVVPPGSGVDAQLGRYVQDGGTLIVLGNAGSLAEACGVKFTGEVRFAKQLQGATVKVDSEYNEQFAAAHLLDDVPGTAWASGDTPMPHWAEITLPEPAEVQAVEVVSRQGPYQVTDVDIELPAGDTWRPVKCIRGATDRTIVARLDAPAATDRIRVSILHELYEGRDRSYADVEAIRVLDSSGRNRARSAIEPVRVSGAVEGELPPSAVAVAPTTAEVVARFDHPDQPPAVLRNRFGNGHALLVTCTAVPSDGPFWNSLCKRTLGEPALLVSAEDGERFRFLLTRVGDSLVLHVIDTAVPAKDYQPKSVEISL